MINSAVIDKNEIISIKENNKEVNKNTRITYVDTAKAIAIFLTILSHSGLNDHPINQFICSFHMPLFFFLSGWIQKDKKISGIKEWMKYILRKIYTLVIPFILYSLIWADGSDVSIYKYILYGTIFSLNKVKSKGTMWFLTCMFSATIIYQIIINIKNSIKNKKIKYLVLGSILVICAVISSYFNFNRMPNLGMPFNINIALSAVVIMFAGNYISKLYNVCKNKFKILESRLIILGMSVLMLFIGMYLHKLNFQAFTIEKYNLGVIMAEAWYGNYVIFIVNSIICSIGIVLLSIVIDNKVLRFFGQNTLIILFFHGQTLGIATQITSKLPVGIYKCFLNSIISFLQMILIIPIINKFFPNLAGKGFIEK